MIQFEVQRNFLQFRVKNPTTATQGASAIVAIPEKTVTTASTIFVLWLQK